MGSVFLSAGHGGTDPGAVAYGLKEKDINLQMLLACSEELIRHGVKVVCSRTKDEYDPVDQEVKEANASKCDINVSFHNNAGKGDGFECYYYPTSKDGKRLSQLFESAAKSLGQNSRGIKTTKSLKFVKKTKKPAVLIETAFLDHDTDNNIIDTVEEQRAFGVAYAKAILEFFGITYIKKETSSAKMYRVQVGAFAVKSNAETLKKELEAKGYKPIIVEG